MNAETIEPKVYDPLIDGLPPELGAAIHALAEAELAAGRFEAARELLEGLVVTSPHDPEGWALLSRAHRRLGEPLAGRFCAEVALGLAPGSGEAALARAESLLAMPDEREAALEVLRGLADHAEAGPRARSLLSAVGAGPA